MKDYAGTEIVSEFINEPVSNDASPFYRSIAENQKRIVFESGRYAVIQAKRVEDIPYKVGQTLNVTYSGPCVNIDKGQEI